MLLFDLSLLFARECRCVFSLQHVPFLLLFFCDWGPLVFHVSCSTQSRLFATMCQCLCRVCVAFSVLFSCDTGLFFLHVFCAAVVATLCYKSVLFWCDLIVECISRFICHITCKQPDTYYTGSVTSALTVLPTVLSFVDFCCVRTSQITNALTLPCVVKVRSSWFS